MIYFFSSKTCDVRFSFELFEFILTNFGWHILNWRFKWAQNFHWGLPLQWSSKESSFLKRTHTVYFIFELNARPINNNTLNLNNKNKDISPCRRANEKIFLWFFNTHKTQEPFIRWVVNSFSCYGNKLTATMKKPCSLHLPIFLWHQLYETSINDWIGSFYCLSKTITWPKGLLRMYYTRRKHIRI